MKNWIQGFECRACGSSLGRWEFDFCTNKIGKMCFVCCAGNFELNRKEVMELSEAEVRQISGREPGKAGQILSRLHTPGSWSSSKWNEARSEHFTRRKVGE